MPRQLRTPPTVIPRAEIERDTAQRQAQGPQRELVARGGDWRNVATQIGTPLGEMVGTEPLARGVMALRGDYTGRPEPGRAAGEFGMAAVNLGLGALGLADDVGALRAARPLPPSMRASAEIAPRPTPPPRQIGRASDGSVLPVREPQPMRQSLVGGSDDLMGAARLNNRPDPHGEGVGADMREPRFFERRGSVNVTTRAQPLPPPASSETGFGALGRGSNNTIAYGMGGIAGLGALAIPATSTAMQALNPIEQAMLEAEAKQRELEAELYALRNGLPSPAYSGALVPPRRRTQQNAPGL